MTEVKKKHKQDGLPYCFSAGQHFSSVCNSSALIIGHDHWHTVKKETKGHIMWPSWYCYWHRRLQDSHFRVAEQPLCYEERSIAQVHSFQWMWAQNSLLLLLEKGKWVFIMSIYYFSIAKGRSEVIALSDF